MKPVFKKRSTYLNNVHPDFNEPALCVRLRRIGKLGNLPENSGFVASAARDRLCGDMIYEKNRFRPSGRQAGQAGKPGGD